MKALRTILLVFVVICVIAPMSVAEVNGTPWFAWGDYGTAGGDNYRKERLDIELGLDSRDWVRAEDVYSVQLIDYWTDSYLVEPERPYPASNMFDDSHNYAWSEGVHGYGDGEEIHAEWESYGRHKWYASGIAIENGYQKTEKIYKRNNRIKDVDIEINGRFYRAHLADYRDWQVIVFQRPIPVSGSGISVTLTIHSVYPGNECDDTCVTRLDLMLMDEYTVDDQHFY